MIWRKDKGRKVCEPKEEEEEALVPSADTEEGNFLCLEDDLIVFILRR